MFREVKHLLDRSEISAREMMIDYGGKKLYWKEILSWDGSINIGRIKKWKT